MAGGVDHHGHGGDSQSVAVPDSAMNPLLQGHEDEHGEQPQLVWKEGKGLVAVAPPAQKLASVPRTFINITKCFVGAASFELASAVSKAGIAGGVIGIVVLGLLSSYTLIILAKCSHMTDHPLPTYPEIGRQAFGPVGKVVVWFGIIAMTLGVCGSYLIFIASSMSALLSGYSSFFTVLACTFLIMPPIIVMSWLRSYKFLAPTSVAGIAALIFALIVVMVDAVKSYDIAPIDYYGPIFNISGYPLFLGNAAFLYLIHSVVIPVEGQMKERHRFKEAVIPSVIFVTIANVIFAVLAFLYFGTSAIGVQGNIIDNLTPGVITTLVRIFLALDLLFTFALFMFPVSDSLEAEIFGKEQFGKPKVEILRNVIRAVLVASTAIIALTVKDFSRLTGLSGGFGNCLLGFILPPVLFLKLKHDIGHLKDLSVKEKLEVGLCVFITSFGLVMMVLSTKAVIQDMT